MNDPFADYVGQAMTPHHWKMLQQVLSSDEYLQTEGQSFYADLRRATGVVEPDDTSDFHDKSLLAIVGKMRRVEYSAM
jgi:hypothetical protein